MWQPGLRAKPCRWHRSPCDCMAVAFLQLWGMGDSADWHLTTVHTVIGPQGLHLWEWMWTSPDAFQGLVGVTAEPSWLLSICVDLPASSSPRQARLTRIKPFSWRRSSPALIPQTELDVLHNYSTVCRTGPSHQTALLDPPHAHVLSVEAWQIPPHPSFNNGEASLALHLADPATQATVKV